MASTISGLDDLSILCKEDHAVKTLAEPQGISIDAARLEKKVIAICKQPVKIIDKYLADNGVVNYPKNKDGRRNAVRDVLKEKEKEDD